jgi:hypothetical protein
VDCRRFCDDRVTDDGRLDETHPSRFVIGELRAIDIPPNASRCGVVLKQPCRADPIARGPSTLRLPKVTPIGVDESFIAGPEVSE